jgi:large subunit ribosomal protein L25
MSQLTLAASPREVAGKQVRQLRRQGLIPAIIYGPKQATPLSIQIKWMELRPILSKAGATRLIQLQLPQGPIDVLVRDVQRHPYRQEVLHLDFYAVDLEQPIKTTVPLVIPNVEAFAKTMQAKVFQPVTKIEVECLPAHIPSQVEVDMSVVKRAGQNIPVKKLPALEGVRYTLDEDVVVVRTVSLTKIADQPEEDLDADMPVSMEVEVIGRGKQEEEEEF